jgi:hypothetical protein
MIGVIIPDDSMIFQNVLQGSTKLQEVPENPGGSRRFWQILDYSGKFHKMLGCSQE